MAEQLPDTAKMRTVLEWCKNSPNYNQRISFFNGSQRCFGGKVLELYYEGNPLRLNFNNEDCSRVIGKILNLPAMFTVYNFIDPNLSLSQIEQNIIRYEEENKPQHNFQVNDYVVVVEQGNLNGRRGKVVDITRMDVFVEFHHGPKHKMEFKPQEIMLEDKSTQLLRKLYRTLPPGTDESEDIGNLLYDLDKQGK